ASTGLPTTPPRHLHSFPTRRSSDLHDKVGSAVCQHEIAAQPFGLLAVKLPIWRVTHHSDPMATRPRLSDDADACNAAVDHNADRSEEHTSERQSHLNLVCRRLLEKK